jgi:hypothetical protein
MKAAWYPAELTYCTNVHAGEDLAQVSGIIRGPLAAVRQNRGLSRMAGGLWLTDIATRSLSSKEDCRRFASQLEQYGIALITLNGFPVRNFHAKRVKEAVYRPDWSEPERLDHTLKLARILARLLAPDTPIGTISSIPLGFGPHWDASRQAYALDALSHCVVELDRIYQQTGKHIRLCLEMEPGCVLQDTDSLIAFFTHELTAHARSKGLGWQLLARYLGICFDVCHQAVMFEHVYQALERIHEAGITIGKIQISSALELQDPDNNDARTALSGFMEGKYLHQTACRDDHGRLIQVLDLAQAFDNLPSKHPWRVHFHVPIQAETLISKHLGTTQYAIGQALDFLRDNPGLHPHLEVETYTWTVLPEEIRPKDSQMVVDGLSGELRWLEEEMGRRKLLLAPPHETAPGRLGYRRTHALPYRRRHPFSECPHSGRLHEPAGGGVSRCDLYGPVIHAHRAATQPTWHRRQRLVLQGPGRGLAVAPIELPRAG